MRHAILQHGCRLVSRAICRPDIGGAKNVPVSGPCLLIFNHLSNFDLPLLYGALPRRDLVGLVAASYRARAWIRPWIEAEGSLWLRRGEADRATLRAARDALARGRIVGMSPEGGRSPTHSLRPAKPGAAALAIRSEVPVLPVGIWGTEHLHKSWSRLHRPPVSIRFGPTFRLDPPSTESRREHRLDATRQLMEAIATLIPPAYRGAYGPEDRAPHSVLGGRRAS